MKIFKIIAKIISWVSHPLFTSCFVIIFFSIKKYSVNEALVVIALLIFGLMVPLNIFTYFRVKSGSYSDFDVSHRKQRSSLYILVIVMMIFTTLLLRWQKVDSQVVNCCLLTTVLFMVVFLANFKIKISLHVCLNTYFCFILYQISPATAIVSAIIIPIIAFSRIYLNRHSFSEVILGGFIGILFGIAFLSYNDNYIFFAAC